jgi:hypothetical protein
MLGATVRRVRRRLMVPERVEPPNALGALDSVGPEGLFRAQFAMRSLLLCVGLGGGDGRAYESTRFS